MTEFMGVDPVTVDFPENNTVTAETASKTSSIIPVDDVATITPVAESSAVPSTRF